MSASQAKAVRESGNSTWMDWFESRFRRITSANAKYSPEVDGVRFVAIALVFLFHLAGDVLRHSPAGYRDPLENDWFFSFTQHGNIGVQIFFVLSGFLLASPFAEHYLNGGKKISMQTYFLRRVTRLEPPYVICLILFLFLKMLGNRGTLADLMPNFWASLLYVHNIVFLRPSDINFVAWSLEVEVQFYILAPAISWLLFRIAQPALRRSLIVGLIAAASLISQFCATAWTGLSLVGQAPYFLAGMLLADFWRSGASYGQSKAKYPALWDLGVVAGIAALCSLHFGWASVSVFAFGTALLTACSVYAMFKGAWFKSFLSLPFVSVVGGMCYSIYLLHNYVIAATGLVTQSFTANLPFAARVGIQSLIHVPLTLGIASAFYLLIERPCMNPRWPSQLWARLNGRSAAPNAVSPERL